MKHLYRLTKRISIYINNKIFSSERCLNIIEGIGLLFVLFSFLIQIIETEIDNEVRDFQVLQTQIKIDQIWALTAKSLSDKNPDSNVHIQLNLDEHINNYQYYSHDKDYLDKWKKGVHLDETSNWRIYLFIIGSILILFPKFIKRDNQPKIPFKMANQDPQPLPPPPMNQLTEYILQFGNLNPQQIELITSKANEIELRKDAYFSEAGYIPKQVGFVVEGVMRGCYYNNKGEEITRCFISENNLVVDYINFDLNASSSEYLQACTDCKLIVFSKQAWEELSQTIVGWDAIKNKMVQLCMYQKSRKGPVISQDATTRYLEFIENYPALTNRIPLTYIASYLGVTQQSLSRIRKNIR